MKKIVLAVALVMALVSGLFAFTGGDSVEIGDSAEAVSELPELGPIELIAHAYAASQPADCTLILSFPFPVICDATPSNVAGFDITGATTATCTAAAGWAISGTTCTATDFSATTSFSGGSNFPCVDTHFATVTLTNPGGHTLVINITGNGLFLCT